MMRFMPAILVFLGCLATAQTPVEVTQEPHHSQILQNKKLQVFKLSLNANERADAIHKHNFLMLALDDCDLAIWREGGSSIESYHQNPGDLRFFFGGQSIGIRNDRTLPCRSVIVEFLDPTVTTYGYQWWANGKWEYGASGLSWPADVSAKFTSMLRLGSAMAIDVQLPPSDIFSPPVRTSDQLVLPITSVELERGDQPPINKAAGDALWIAAREKTDLVNRGEGVSRFVVLEVLVNQPGR